MKYYEEDLATEAYCVGCREKCETTIVDIGIGSYEFWGHRGIHRDERELSVCCHDEFQSEPFGGDDDE